MTATAGTATAGTATTVSLSHSTTVASVLTGTSDGRSVTTLRRSLCKRTPVSPLRDNSPKKKKTKPASSSTTSSRKKGGGLIKPRPRIYRKVLLLGVVLLGTPNRRR